MSGDDRVCDDCGQLYIHTVTAGPGRSKRSCGCDAVLNPVADDTENAFANAAIRALNASGDVETAARIYEATRDRLLADGGVPESFESLASTCESCGDDVDPERLIEGECPGCHYRPMTDGGAREETIQNWLVINWREGTTRTRKSKPDASKLGTHELTTSLTLNVTIPDVDVPELVADVEVPQPRVEASELSDLEAEDSPDWMDLADEIVDEHPEADPFDEVDQLVVAVLEDAPGKPDVKEVKRYLQQQLRELQRGEHQ